MSKGNILLTMAEDPSKTTDTYFGVKYSVDEEDCFDFSNALIKKGYSVQFVNWADFDFSTGEFTRMFDDNSKQFIEPRSLSQFDLLFAYKQEGFLATEEGTSKFYSMLDFFSSTSAVVVNDPKTIKSNISKEYMIDMMALGLSVIPTYRYSQSILDRISSGEQFIVKPKIGERGDGQKKVSSLEDLSSFSSLDNYLFQEFAPDIRNGERSLVFLGDTFCHAVLKRPNPNDPDEYRCNESLGGTVEEYFPSEKEINFSKEILSFWSNQNLPVHYSRVDIIVNAQGDPCLLEAELLNPSIYANYLNRGPEFGIKIANYFDAVLQKSEKVLR